ncbi:MAG: aminopeptidase P family N-terminal domain-containing protein, partial [Defluviicoccus sp.]|nr:aminopeptidase P family N-terminal domain-containing protein [Defluviicoccus sp.]
MAADIDPAHLEPHYSWGGAIPAPGHGGVDTEERVNFDRLRDYRLARAKQALESSGLGALLCFDNNNIRYLTGTAIGEWSRDKMSRYALLMRGEEPHVWDFGSAASHHRIHAPWLKGEHVHAGMLGLRGTVPPDAGLMTRAAEQIKSMLDEAGVGDMPIGVDICEPPMLFELQKRNIEVRDGQQVMLDAREVKNIDEIVLLNQAAGMVD